MQDFKAGTKLPVMFLWDAFGAIESDSKILKKKEIVGHESESSSMDSSQSMFVWRKK